MSAQPLKLEVDFERFFSNEIKQLINTTLEDIIGDFPSATITSCHFIAAGISNPDCMMYKMLNGFLTTVRIEELYSSFYKLLTQKGCPIVHAGKPKGYSNELRSFFIKCIELKKEFNAEYITSDLVLLSIMKEESTPIYDIFANESLTYQILNDLAHKLHDTANAIISTEEDKWNRWTFGLDLSDKKDNTAITVINAKDFIDKSNKKNPNCCISLNSLAERKKIGKVIGREREIKLITKILNRRRCNNVLLIGDSGVGKTAIVEGLAWNIVNGTSSNTIKSCEILQLDGLSLMTDTQYRGLFETKMLALIKELNSKKNAILFIDNIHSLLGEHQKNEFDFGSFLSSIFENSDVKVIAATTAKGYHGTIESVASIKDKFQLVNIDKPSVEECEAILKGIYKEYENYHGVEYSDDVIHACVTLSNRYITDKSMPSSAIDILDEVSAAKKLLDDDIILAKKNIIADLTVEKDKLIREDKINESLDITEKINDLKAELGNLNENALNTINKKVTVEDVYATVAEHTGIPVQKLNISEKKSLLKIDEILKKIIVGQDEAIDVVTRAIRRNKVGLSPKNRPILSCLCVGSTGTGKTLMAKTLAKEIFGDEKYLVRFDMSEYSDKTAVNKLIGASAGYVGYNEGGLLSEAIKHKKHAVLLIDEIEKATDEIFNIFLQILDEGFMTDNTGLKVDFRNIILIMTSNIGAQKATNEKSIGFSVNENSNKRDIIEKEMKNKFSPEFINRLDEIVYFNNLTNENLKNIIQLELNKTKTKIQEIGNDFSYDNSVVDYIFSIVEKNKEYGARPILRTIQREIENRIADILLDNDYQNHIFKVKYNNYLIIE